MPWNKKRVLFADTRILLVFCSLYHSQIQAEGERLLAVLFPGHAFCGGRPGGRRSFGSFLGFETIHEILGIDEMKRIPSYVASILQRGVGFHYTADRTVDKPAICVYLLADTLEQAKKDINRLNEVFDVRNAEGKSLLMKKYNPDNL